MVFAWRRRRWLLIGIIGAVILSPWIWCGWEVWRQVAAMRVLRSQGARLDVFWWDLRWVGGVPVALPAIHPEVRVSFENGRADFRTAAKLRRVVALSCFEGTTVPDEELSALRRFQALDSLWIEDTAVNPRVLEYLPPAAPLEELLVVNVPLEEETLGQPAAFPSLYSVLLKRTGVGDGALKALSRLPNLKRLTIIGSRLTAQGLSRLRALPGLTELKLLDCGLDDGAVEFVALPWLETLTLRENPLGDRGCERLVAAEMRSLRNLNLAFTNVGDKGLRILTAIAGLETLDLCGTLVTDEGVGWLGNLRLRDVYLEESRVTKAGIEKLSTLCPYLEIHWRDNGRRDLPGEPK